MRRPALSRTYISGAVGWTVAEQQLKVVSKRRRNESFSCRRSEFFETPPTKTAARRGLDRVDVVQQCFAQAVMAHEEEARRTDGSSFRPTRNDAPAATPVRARTLAQRRPRSPRAAHVLPPGGRSLRAQEPRQGVNQNAADAAGTTSTRRIASSSIDKRVHHCRLRSCTVSILRESSAPRVRLRGGRVPATETELHEPTRMTSASHVNWTLRRRAVGRRRTISGVFDGEAIFFRAPHEFRRLAGAPSRDGDRVRRRATGRRARASARCAGPTPCARRCASGGSTGRAARSTANATCSGSRHA